MADVHTPAQRRWNMSQIKGRDTKPEKLLRSMLHRAGYRFRLFCPELPGRPDIVLPRYRTAIFVHGCYWHRHKGCRYTTNPKTNSEFWNEKFADTMARDKRKVRQLRAQNWRTLTVWECELKHSSQKTFERVRRRLERGV